MTERMGGAGAAPEHGCEQSSVVSRSFRKSGGERGAGTVLVLGIVLATGIALLGLMAIGDAAATKERTQDIADVAALAGAQKLRHSTDSSACTQAEDVVQRHNLTLTSCVVAGEHVRVTVQSRARLINASVESSATAGPADQPP